MNNSCQKEQRIDQEQEGNGFNGEKDCKVQQVQGGSNDCQVKLQLKDKECKNHIKAMEHQSVIQNHYKPADQLVKDASVIRKAY